MKARRSVDGIALALAGVTALGALALLLPLRAGRARGPVASPLLASWATVGGCGAAGGPASGAGGGIQWIGRNVTGGLLDTQALTVVTRAQGNQLTTFALRLGMAVSPRLGVALHLPIVHKAGEVAVLGTTREATIAGFGDVGLELGVKLGAIGQHQLMLTASAPTGSADAVRQGVVLPQHLQLGSGVPGLTGQYQLTRDQDWGLVVAGATASYAGWENDLGDHRAPSATVYGHAGYLLGPLVPSVGLTLYGKAGPDRERDADRPTDEDPRLMLVPSVGCEWSSDWLAILPAFTMGLSSGGVESVSLGLGISSSLF